MNPTHATDLESQNQVRRHNRVAASPRARRATRQRNIDLAQVQGTGPNGRITEADVLQAAAGPTTALHRSHHGSQLSAMRRSIARVTAASCATVPQFHLRVELDATALVTMRAQLLERVQADDGVRLSVTDLMLRAMALGLRDFPRANAIWRNETIEQLSDAGVGLVVNLDDGLLIPSLRAADRLSVGGLARARHQAVASARAGYLAGDASRSVASSLSNLGTTRVDEFSAVIFPPQSTMLTAGRIAPRPFVVDGQLSVRPTLRLTLSVDHRVLDGAPAAQFLTGIVQYLENPALMLYTQP